MGASVKGPETSAESQAVIDQMAAIDKLLTEVERLGSQIGTVRSEKTGDEWVLSGWYVQKARSLRIEARRMAESVAKFDYREVQA